MTDDERPDTGTDLDRAIDLAVRAMLDVDPRADLRARVIERIEQPRRRFRWTWVLAPIAAAAVLVVVVMLWRLAQVREGWPTDIVLHSPETTGQMASTIVSPPPVVRVARRANLQRRGTAAALASPEAGSPVIQLDPLRRIDAISVAPVTLQAVDTERIAIAPLTPIAEIEIEPVTPSGGRN